MFIVKQLVVLFKLQIIKLFTCMHITLKRVIQEFLLAKVNNLELNIEYIFLLRYSKVLMNDIFLV